MMEEYKHILCMHKQESQSLPRLKSGRGASAGTLTAKGKLGEMWTDAEEEQETEVLNGFHAPVTDKR